jgi:glyoxylase-like metal-dependent hydrolase (beta-lactamase superfamily II)
MIFNLKNIPDSYRIIVSVILLVLMISISYLIAGQTFVNDDEEIDKQINIVRLTDKIALFKFGYDAVVAISTQKGIAVVDAGISNSLTARYRKLIEKVFNKKLFSYLMITHSHWDHTGGNQDFRDAVIIAQKNSINEMTDYWINAEKKKNDLLKIIDNYKSRLNNSEITRQDSLEICQRVILYTYVYNDLMNNRILTLPTKTFDDTLNISSVDINFQLIYFGPGHSGSDILIYVPEEKVLFIGDLFTKYGRPSIDDLTKMNMVRWAEVKNWIEKRIENIVIVINGHGNILEKTDLISFEKFIDKKGGNTDEVLSY